MSSFYCEHCGKEILDSDNGYITACEHYPFEHTSIVKRKSKRAYIVRKKKTTIDPDITAQCGEQ